MILICVCIVNVNVGLTGIARYAVEVWVEATAANLGVLSNHASCCRELLQFLRCKQLEGLSVVVVIVEQQEQWHRISRSAPSAT